MRRFGGWILVAALAVAGCSIQRNAEFDAAAGSPATTGSTQPPPPLNVELAAEPTPSPTAEIGDDGTAPPVLDPVPTGSGHGVRRAAAPTPPSGPQPTGHLDIPAIGLSHPTYDGIDLATINHGPSHWPGTARPGHRGNTVFPGHRTTYSRPFWDIDHLVPGDEVTFTTVEGRFTYRVTRTFVVDDEETWIVEPTDGATFTIFGCHPKGSARQRYVAKGELVSAPATATTTTTTTTRPPSTTTTTEPDESLLDVLFG